MGIDDSLKKRKKQNAIDEQSITHRAILEPQLERVTAPRKPQQRQNRKGGNDVIRNTIKR